VARKHNELLPGVGVPQPGVLILARRDYTLTVWRERNRMDHVMVVERQYLLEPGMISGDAGDD